MLLNIAHLLLVFAFIPSNLIKQGSQAIVVLNVDEFESNKEGDLYSRHLSVAGAARKLLKLTVMNLGSSRRR